MTALRRHVSRDFTGSALQDGSLVVAMQDLFPGALALLASVRRGASRRCSRPTGAPCTSLPRSSPISARTLSCPSYRSHRLTEAAASCIHLYFTPHSFAKLLGRLSPVLHPASTLSSGLFVRRQKKAKGNRLPRSTSCFRRPVLSSNQRDDSPLVVSSLSAG